MSTSTPDEIAVYDELISVRPEFYFHVGLSKRFWGNRVGWDAADIKFGEQTAVSSEPETEKNTARTGIAWLMALARIELSGSLSAYTNEKNPFFYLQPTQFDVRQYEVLLFDDAMSHLLSLKHDPRFKKVSHPARFADAESIDYLRRSKLVKDIVKAARQTSLNSEYAEKNWKQEYKAVSRMSAELRESISVRLQSYNTARTTNREERSLMQFCGSLLAAENRGEVESRQRAPVNRSSGRGR